jgi:hypothetical protein
MPELSGIRPTAVEMPSYAAHHEFIGNEYFQLGLRQLETRLPLRIVMALLGRPDPESRLDTNRKIDPRHAQDFAQYLIRGAREPEKYQYFVPAGVVYISSHLVEIDEVIYELQGVERCVKFRIRASDRPEEFDLQHRNLGYHLAEDWFQAEIRATREQLARTTPDGESEDHDALVREAEQKLTALEEAHERFLNTVEPLIFILNDDAQLLGGLFSDVNDKQKGMAKSAIVRLDKRVAFDRVAWELHLEPLLDGMVDEDRDSVTRNNPHWITLRDLEQIIRLAYWPYGARWNTSKEAGLVDQEIFERAAGFLDVLVNVFPELDALLNSESLEATALRGGGSQPTLLASSTMLKALAIVYRNLLDGAAFISVGSRVRLQEGLPKADLSVVEEVFRDLPSMASGEATLDEFWKATGVFQHPWFAPNARKGNDRILAKKMEQLIRTTDQQIAG